jgi:hypothetical protein
MLGGAAQNWNLKSPSSYLLAQAVPRFKGGGCVASSLTFESGNERRVIGCLECRVGNANGLRWRGAQDLVNPAEIVMCDVQRDRRDVVVQLL